MEWTGRNEEGLMPSELAMSGSPLGLRSKFCKEDFDTLLLEQVLQSYWFAGTQPRASVELLSGASSKTPQVSRPAKTDSEEDLRAKISELEQKLAEAERMNATQRSRLVEERRAAATANRLNDQLQARLDEFQQRLDRQLDIINERARANDVALAALAANVQGRLLTYERLRGEVIEVDGDQVVVRIDTDNDIIEQTYDVSQFKFGKAPAVGDQLEVHVHVARIAAAPSAPATETIGNTHESPRRRNAIAGDHRF